jgi:uncharacterized DUF497 family protein
VQYEWDVTKAASNLKKHGVTFEEAAVAAEDPFALVIADVAHGEVRLNVICRSTRVLFLVVVEIDNDVARIVSARKATPAERRQYEDG